MNYSDKILIGGSALVTYGSSRSTEDTDYLINDTTTNELFIHDNDANIDYINANGGNKFFSTIFEIENGNEIATPKSLVELKCYALAQHCELGNWQKADDAEYDIKFLCRKFNIESVLIVLDYVSEGAKIEINKIINSVK